MAYQTSLQSQTMELLVAYRNQPSVHLRNRLVRLNFGLVRQVAHRFTRQCAEPYEDLEQCGALGLIAAIERFDPIKGYAFSSFAVPSIRGEILHYLRDRANTVRIPRHWHQLYQKSQKVKQILLAELGRQPSEQELADKLGLSINEWCSVRIAASNRVPISLDLRLSSKGQVPNNSVRQLEDIILDACDQIEKINQEERLDLFFALEKIEKSTNEAIQLVFVNQLSRQEAARQLGVSPATITRRINRGIAELRDILQKPLLLPTVV